MIDLPTSDLSAADPPTNDRPHLQKTLRRHHGAMLALPVAMGLFITAGFTIAAVGAWPAIAICVVLAVVALLQNNLFAEMAAMFPDKPGGVAVYAHEAWKQHFAPLGALASFGYWCGWALVLALLGITMGSLVQAQWFPDATATVSTGLAEPGLPAAIGAAAVVLAVVVNLSGITVAVRVNQVVGAVFVVVLLAMIVLPFASGGWNPANLAARRGPVGWLEDDHRVALRRGMGDLRQRAVRRVRPRIPRHEPRHREGHERHRRAADRPVPLRATGHRRERRRAGRHRQPHHLRRGRAAADPR